MNSSAVRRLVLADSALLWRPFFSFGLIATASVLWGAIETSLMAPAIFVATVALIAAAVRSLLWSRKPGRVSVTFSAADVSISGGLRADARFNIASIDAFDLREGDSYPEWSRWAGFPGIEIRLVDGTRVNERDLLIRDRHAVEVTETLNSLLAAAKAG